MSGAVPYLPVTCSLLTGSLLVSVKASANHETETVAVLAPLYTPSLTLLNTRPVTVR